MTVVKLEQHLISLKNKTKKTGFGLFLDKDKEGFTLPEVITLCFFVTEKPKTKKRNAAGARSPTKPVCF